jgi:predicted RNA-binding Zn ribbon-like protein
VVSSLVEEPPVEHGEDGWAARHPFDLSGGALCLDFVNTLEDRPTERQIERIGSYADLLAFTRATASLPVDMIESLTEEARRQAAEVGAALARGIAVREAIFRLGAALTVGLSAPPGDLEMMNRALAEALGHARLVRQPDHSGASHFGWGWVEDPISLDAPLWPIVRSVADLLTSPMLPALRLCASDTCDWLFLDGSRNGSRRWCSMKTCGNRAKARRHYARRVAPDAPARQAR